MRHPLLNLGTAVLVAALPLAAQAHPGHELQASFTAGLMHPMTGWDHLLVLLCLGVLAAGRGARTTLGAGALLAVALAGGAAVGLAFPGPALVEQAVLATVLVSVALLVSHVQIGSGALLTLCLGFMLVHGMAHGQEAPTGGSLTAYFAGFTLAGTALYAVGAWLALSLERLRGARPSRSRAPI